MHKAPNGKEGYLYTAEEVYEMLIQNAKKKKSSGSGNCEDQSGKQGGADGFGKTTDDHSKWGKGASSDKQEELEELWKHRVAQAVESIKIRESSTSRGLLPLGAKRLIEELKSSKVNWRELLQKFIQEEICDYSFNPPDRRFDDSPFFLPDFNEVEESVANVLFMIDTSGSMSDKDITLAYSEVKGAIDQFNGKLKGYLGFFDAEVVPPTPFESVEDFLKIKAKGGGGTSFEVIFNYVNKAMVENLPKSIIILTDGYAPFPDEKKANGIPTLWLINNNEINPPWGKVARFID
jgi:predicted metal-dependent peptidase